MHLFSTAFYHLFDIASVQLLLIPLDCSYFAVPKAERGINVQFPGTGALPVVPVTAPSSLHRSCHIL
jgi:hypothetical protein